MLTDAEYRHIKRNMGALEQAVAGAEADEEAYDLASKQAHDRKMLLEDEMSVYTNLLSDAIAEYEEAHPPEEQEE